MAYPINLEKFKKVRVEKDHTVLRHPDGHEIRVLHKPLSPKMKEKLDGLAHYSEGGQVGEYAGLKENYRTEGFKEAHNRGKKIVNSQINEYAEGGNVKLEQAHKENKVSDQQKDAQQPQQIDPQAAQSVQQSMRKSFHYDQGGPIIDPNKVQTAQQSMRKAFHFAEGTPDAPVGQSSTSEDPAHAFLDSYFASKYQQPDSALMEDKAVAEAPVASPEVAVQPEQPPLAPTPQGTLPQQAMQNAEQANQAAMQMGANTQQAESAKSQAFGQQAQQDQAIHQKYEQLGNEIHAKFQQTADQVAEGKIDPSHWWNNKSTGSKVLTAVGMLFAGAAGGIAGHPEMVGNIINKFIDNDIESQKADLSNKNTLLGKYMEMYNSLPQAENAARLTLSAATEGLVNKAATKLGSDNALLAAKQWAISNRQEQLKNLQGLAQGQLMLGALGDLEKPGNPSSNGIDMERWQKLKMAGFMKEGDEAAATKEAQQYSEARSLKDAMEGSAKHLEKQLFRGALSPNDTHSAINAFAGRIAKVGEGRFNLQEAGIQAKALLPQPLDTPSTIKNKAKRREDFFKSLAQTPTLQRMGLISQPQSTGDMVLMSTPDGRQIKIPSQNVEAAKKRGAKTIGE